MRKKILSLILLVAFSVSFLTLNVTSVKVFAQVEEDYSAKSIYLMDYSSNEVLFEKNAYERRPVASIVKLMTIYLTCKEIENGNLKLEDEITASSTASSMGGSQVFIEEGGIYTVGDLLKSAIVSSANDASVLLSEVICGDEENFVDLMNKTAKELDLNNTNYVNCTGLPAVNQFSCARDVSMLLKEVTKFDIYHKYSTIWMDTLKHPNNRESELVNTNKLIRYYEGCDGGKTGSTSEAGYCLTATAKRGDLRLIGTVLGTENSKKRFAECSKLFNFGFANFENKEIVSKNYLDNTKLKVKNGQKDEISLKVENNIYLLTKKRADKEDIEIKVILPEEIDCPIKANDKVGEVVVIKNGEVINKTNIVALEDIEKASIFDNIKSNLQKWKIV